MIKKFNSKRVENIFGLNKQVIISVHLYQIKNPVEPQTVIKVNKVYTGTTVFYNSFFI